MTHELVNFRKVPFEKVINLNANVKVTFSTAFPKERLRKYYDMIKGVTYDKNDQVYRETRNGILTADNITLENNLEIVKKVYLDESFPINERAKLSSNDIFICLSSGSRKHVGKVAYIQKDLPYFAGGFMGIMRENESGKASQALLPKYVYSLLAMPATREYMSKICTGANIKNLADRDVDIKIPVPPMTVQKSIVAELEGIESKERDCLDRLSVLQDELSKRTWFSFDTERVERISVMVQRGKSARYGTSRIQIIKSGQARGYNEFDFSKRYYVSDDFVSDERNLQKGDILINSTGVGTAGRVSLFDFDGEYVADSHVTIVRLNLLKAMPKYVLYALANIGFKNIEAMATGQSGQIELALSTINAIRIPLPPLETQKEIVRQIEQIEQEMGDIKEAIRNAERQKQAILDKYLNESI